MKLFRQHNIINGLLLLAATCISSCNSIMDDDSLPVSKENIALSFTRSNESTTALDDNSKFRVAFFIGNDYSFFNSTDDLQGIDRYRENSYDTAIPYPSNTSVYAVGFAPTDHLNVSDDHKTLTLAGNKAGTVDVLASQTVMGSSNNRFSNKTPLEFQHLLTKVTFLAKRDKKMQNSKRVHDVKVTPNVSYLINKWEYNTDTYIASANQEANESLTLHEDGQYLTNIEEEYLIGTCYLHLPANNNGEITFNLEAILSPVNTSEDIPANYGEIRVNLMEADNHTPVATAKPGEAYEVLINFTQDSFTLTGVKAPWKTGGLITVPINPTKQ